MIPVLIALVLFFIGIAIQLYILEVYFPNLHRLAKALIISAILALVLGIIRGWICSWLCVP